MILYPPLASLLASQVLSLLLQSKMATTLSEKAPDTYDLGTAPREVHEDTVSSEEASLSPRQKLDRYISFIPAIAFNANLQAT